MRVVFAAGAGGVVDGRGPGTGVAGAVREVADRVAELAADRPPEGVRDAGAGLAGDRGDPSQGGQGLRVGEPGPAVPGLGQQPGRAYRAGPGQGGKMCPSGWAASWAPIVVSRALIWAASAVTVAVRAAVTAAWAAPSSPVTPPGAASSRARSTPAEDRLPLHPAQHRQARRAEGGHRLEGCFVAGTIARPALAPLMASRRARRRNTC